MKLHITMDLTIRLEILAGVNTIQLKLLFLLDCVTQICIPVYPPNEVKE